jgi:hypothetical protein
MKKRKRGATQRAERAVARGARSTARAALQGRLSAQRRKVLATHYAARYRTR